MNFDIVSDSSCNLLDGMIEEFNIHILPLSFMIDGEHHSSYTEGEPSDLKRFYTMMRQGKAITTSLPNRPKSTETFVNLLEAGRDILYIGFSSGLSGTYETTAMLLESLKQSYPDRKILSVDTFAASMGEGLIVYKAAQIAASGASIEEVYQWVLDNRFHVAHWFTVDDLMFLSRGGRLSRKSARAGTLISIKPVMHMDDAGLLIPMENVRGRKKSLISLVKHMEKSAIHPVRGQTVFLTHGDCEEDALFVLDEVRHRFGCTDIHYNFVDPVIGAHSGPGTVALFFMANQR